MLLENTKVLILDDEPDALAQSREVMEQFVPPHRILTTTDQGKAMDLIGKDQVDLLFLDVEMPGLNGFALADCIHKLKPELKYVFLTGHTELGAESYDYEPIGFLSKPVDPQRLQRTLERYRDRRFGASAAGKKDQVALETKAGFVLISPADIRYIAKEGRRTVIHCTGQDYQVQYSLDALEAVFSDYGLFRLHQSVLAPMDRIVGVQMSDFGNTFTAVLDDASKLPVSRRSYTRLRELLTARGVRFM